MVSPMEAVQKVGLAIVLIPLMIVIAATLLAFMFFYISTGGFHPTLTDQLLGVDPIVKYLLLSVGFGFAVLFMMLCGSVIHIAVEIYRIRKALEKPA